MSECRDPCPDRVLARYPAPLCGRSEPHIGGFSGACLWKVHTVSGPLCLRAGSPSETRSHLAERHHLMRLARRAGLTFVPTVLDASHGESVVEHGGLWWELMEWMPGVASFRAAPSETRLRAAAVGLGRLHTAWQDGGSMSLGCPAVTRRLDAVTAWRPGTLPRNVANRRLVDAVERWLPRVPWLLREVTFPVRVQPCMRDVWHDNLLFEGERLAGLVDYAAVGIDSVAADLARMLGSLVGDNEEGWRVGLRAYREVAPLSAEEERLARVLDVTGVVVALAGWLIRLKAGAVLDNEKASRRVAALLARVEGWRGPLASS